MRFIVYGVGAIGGVLAARLVQSGHEVTALARGEHARRIAEVGLEVRTPEGSDKVPLPVVEDPKQLDFDGAVVLLCVKSQDTPGALKALQRTADRATPVVCAQNGVDNERAALRLFSNVYAVCVMCPAVHLEPGIVQAHSTPITGILDIGRYPGGRDDLCERVAQALSGATYVSEVRSDIMRWKYAKLLMNLGNAIEAVCGTQARQGPIYRVVRREGVAALQAAGLDFASAEEDAARRGNLLNRRPIGDGTRVGASSWQSLHRATGSVEADWLNGEISLLGRLHGVPTPANDLLGQLANQMAASGAAPAGLSEAEVMARVDEAIALSSAHGYPIVEEESTR
jgi:2-dehydropantoate 2-reductase